MVGLCKGFPHKNRPLFTRHIVYVVSSNMFHMGNPCNPTSTAGCWGCWQLHLHTFVSQAATQAALLSTDSSHRQLFVTTPILYIVAIQIGKDGRERVEKVQPIATLRPPRQLSLGLCPQRLDLRVR